MREQLKSYLFIVFLNFWSLNRHIMGVYRETCHAQKDLISFRILHLTSFMFFHYTSCHSSVFISSRVLNQVSRTFDTLRIYATHFTLRNIWQKWSQPAARRLYIFFTHSRSVNRRENASNQLTGKHTQIERVGGRAFFSWIRTGTSNLDYISRVVSAGNRFDKKL